MKRPRTTQIPPERKALYYAGLALSGLGLVLFLSVFVSFAAHFGDFADFEARTRSGMFRAIGGIVLLMVGGALTGIAARGLAGSGVLLDPERARADLEPWNRMAGVMAQDALSEIEIVGKLADRLDDPAPAPQVQVRCRSCRALNDESARFCDQCGAAL